jgi:hypothetical protein
MVPSVVADLMSVFCDRSRALHVSLRKIAGDEKS